MEAVETRNALSVLELRTHGELQDRALKWLYNLGHIVVNEVELPNGRRCDVIGYDESGRIIIIEVKASVSDFRNDEKGVVTLNSVTFFIFC
ncbi:MmcB family DNA repair protein [Paenibacillus sp. LMG 31458]|uniref:MmcB family DNA repair protein n=1 Tax=Paenibacillus phytorum TaxID=2654977 RepID=A0ABX1XTK5_9BACL|nr:MmcB family DNA repair protein [Paenibacillus phytorum]